MHKIGVKTYLLRIVDQFLTNRILQVRVNNTYSKPFTPFQGVPQGSPLSPLLYNIYCHDIYSANVHHLDTELYILQFADDTTLISHGKNLNKTIDKLQTLYNNTLDWFHKWRLSPNPDKYQLFIPNHRITESSPRIWTGEQYIKPSPTMKYLGIRFDSQLKLTKHYKLIRAEMAKRSRYFRALTYKSKGISLKHATTIYKSICRPLLDYGHILTANTTRQTVDVINKAERKSLRIITKIRHPNNPLHNIRNEQLYERTQITPIRQRHDRLRQNFIRNPQNRGILDRLCIKLTDTIQRQRNTTLYVTLTIA